MGKAEPSSINPSKMLGKWNPVPAKYWGKWNPGENPSTVASGGIEPTRFCYLDRVLCHAQVVSRPGSYSPAKLFPSTARKSNTSLTPKAPLGGQILLRKRTDFMRNQCSVSCLQAGEKVGQYNLRGGGGGGQRLVTTRAKGETSFKVGRMPP